jgi:hypothetical protein
MKKEWTYVLREARFSENRIDKGKFSNTEVAIGYKLAILAFKFRSYARSCRSYCEQSGT